MFSGYNADGQPPADFESDEFTPGDEYALVHEAVTNEEAEVVRATLASEGILAVLSNVTVNPIMGGLEQSSSDTWRGGVFVPNDQAEAARALLAAQPLTEAELTAAEEADPTTLEQAEAEVKNA